ncbi:lamin tail domain-containing protein [Flammeovirga pacifica]|uniref:LTD domain-containing protein n=1 Tax=Flammeovirga pacifica TaxID=915059 RepID=A0A1S1Z2F6_FLAPC|nr:lamin tail domain-containing protein [Flammeovirga pacifica]OHX67422.1 hypothetical protein NH26_14255 [Flammeovirga pacifica]
MHYKKLFFALLFNATALLLFGNSTLSPSEYFYHFGEKSDWVEKFFSSGTLSEGGYQFKDDSTLQLISEGGSGKREIQFIRAIPYKYAPSEDTLMWSLAIKNDFEVSSTLQKTNYSTLLLSSSLQISFGRRLNVVHQEISLLEKDIEWNYKDWNHILVYHVNQNWWIEVNNQKVASFTLRISDDEILSGISSTFTASSRSDAFFYKHFTFQKKIKQKDVFPPYVEGISFINDASIQIKFNEEIQLDCGETSLFELQGNTIESVLFIDSTSLELQLSEVLQQNAVVKLSFDYICDNEKNILLEYQIDTFYTDTQPPKLLSYEIVNPFTLKLFFSEEIFLDSSFNSFYQNDITIESSHQSINDTTLLLYFEAPFPENKNINFSVSSLKDTFENSLNTTFLIHFDTQKPRVVAHYFIPPNLFKITFSEQMEDSVLLDEFNYHIDNRYVTKVESNINNEVVLALDTSLLEDSKSYKLQVRHLQDLKGNLIKNRYLSFVFDTIPPNISHFETHDTGTHVVFTEPISSIDSLKVNHQKVEIAWEGCSKNIYSLPLLYGDNVTFYGLLDNQNIESTIVEHVVYFSNDSSVFIPFDEIYHQLSILDEYHIQLSFEENIQDIFFDENSGIAHYQVKGKEVFVTLSQAIEESQSYEILINQVELCGGNLLTSSSITYQLDRSPPYLMRLETMDRRHIRLQYSEKLSERSVINERFSIENYTIIQVELKGDEVVLVLEQELEFNQENILKVQAGLEDASLNKMNEHQFLFFTPDLPLSHHLVLNEIMIDPTPSYGSPVAEYIELYNSSKDSISLWGGYLIFQEEVVSLPSIQLPPDSYAIVVNAEDAFLFDDSLHLIKIDKLPTLHNNKGSLQLYFDEQLYDEVQYPFINNENIHFKGGYSLERVDPTFFCDYNRNWKSCQHLSGNTLGRENSIFAFLEDTKPPEIKEITWVSSRSIQVVFDEVIRGDSVNNTTNYSLLNVDNSVNNLEFVDNYTLIISFEKDLPTGMLIFLTVDNFVDCFSNFQFYYQKPFVLPQKVEYQQMLVSELMIDHSPKVKMPETEYIEIHNNSMYYLLLSECIMLLNNDTIQLPNNCIIPGGYAVLCDENEVDKFLGDKNVVGLPHWKSLNNTSGDLRILNKDLGLVDEVFYHKDYHNDAEKKNGGWSLERIDISNDCFEGVNWTSSISNNGGTAGEKNSVSANIIDQQPPLLEKVYAINDTLLFIFDEVISERKSNKIRVETPAFILEQKDFVFDGHQLISVIKSDEELDHINIEQATDCFGNAMSQTAEVIQISSENPSLFLSEILFDPSVLNTDFVELYNAADVPVLLNDWWLSNGEEYHQIVSDDDILWVNPHSWIVLSDEKVLLMSNYNDIDEKNIIEMKLPSLPNAGGSLSLWKGNQLIEEMTYGEHQHQSYLRDTEDVSLERISYQEASDENTNWASATSNVGYATPTKRNSRFENTNVHEMSLGGLSINKRLITPNEDGIDDYLIVKNVSEQMVRIFRMDVYSLSGKKIKELVQNYTLSSGGTVKWDGTTDSRERMYGQFILYIHLENQRNIVETYSQVVSIAPWN